MFKSGIKYSEDDDEDEEDEDAVVAVIFVGKLPIDFVWLSDFIPPYSRTFGVTGNIGVSLFKINKFDN